MEKDANKDSAFFYVLSLGPLARYMKPLNPRKLG